MPRLFRRCSIPTCFLSNRILFFCLLLLTIQIAAIAPPAGCAGRAGAERARHTQGVEEVRPLEPGKPVERELAGGQSHSYRITLAAGQYLRLVVDQRGIDVAVTLFDTDGKKVTEVDSPNGTQGLEAVSAISEAAGAYRIEVRSLEKTAEVGRYEIKIEELRVATEQDRGRVAANRFFMEAEHLRGEGSLEASHKAIGKYEEALSLWRAANDREGEASALHAIGQAYDDLGEFKKTLEYYTEVLALRHNAKDPRREALILHDIGEVHHYTGENQKAIDYYNQALKVSREASARDNEALLLFRIGGVYSTIGEKQQALDFYNRALSLYQAIGDREGEADTLTAIGEMYGDLGENQAALDYYNQALPLWRTVFNRSGEAKTLNRIGEAYFQLRNMQSALNYYNQALQLRRTARDRRGEAITINNIGVVYGVLGDYQKSLAYHNQALILRREWHDLAGEAVTLYNIGSIYRLSGETSKALGYFNLALSLYRRKGDPRGESYSLRSIGIIYSLSGEKEKALENLNQALKLIRIVGDRVGEGNTLSNIGRVYDSAGEKQKAQDCYHQALLITQSVRDPLTEAATLAYIARADRDLGNLAEARAHSESSLKITESLRAGVTDPELRSSFFASVQDRYDFYIDLLMRSHWEQPAAGHNAEALQASERARARTLLELLSEARADIRQGVDLALLTHERDLQQQINTKAAAQTRLLSGRSTEGRAAALAKEIEVLIIRYQEVEAQIRATSPRYAALTQPQPLTTLEIQQQLLDPDTLLLEYALGQEHSYLWAVTPNSVISYPLPPRAEIETAAQRVRDLLLAHQPQLGLTDAQQQERETKADEQYWPQAAALSQTLLGPVAEQLGTKRLVIVPSGALQYLPFAALPAPRSGGKSEPNPRSATRNPQSFMPLIVEHEIVSLPSASVLAVLRREVAGRQPAAKTVAVLADPVFGRDDPRVKAGGKTRAPLPHSGAETRETALLPALPPELERAVRDVGAGKDQRPLSRLPFSRQEAEAIAAAAPKGSVMRALDFEASRATATGGELGQYRIVHFATHGLLDSEHPELSGLVFSLVDPTGKPQDGYLRLHEIYNLRLAADVVVLSACRTGLGKDIKGEGLVGLTRGFMYAGAPRVVASLWQVDDVATAELMKRFYRGMLREGLRPAAALRAAQIEMWKKKQWQAPFYWSAFVLQGEWK